MINTEFSITGDGSTVMIIENQKPILFTEENGEVIKHLFKIIENNYPKAFDALKEEYGHRPKYKYLAVRRFIKCNWGNDDEKKDIDENGNFNFEHVRCPLRGGDCIWENTICHPVDATDLTPREIDVLKLIATGYTNKEIAERLTIALKTVESHRENLYLKLAIHKSTQLVEYAHKHNLI
jgi:DNA-binding CsgD family transcriptional regulator